MANADPISILAEVLQAAAGVDPYVIIHFEQRGDTFCVWPRDNGAPFTVTLANRIEHAQEKLIATLTDQAREGDEAVAAIARVRSLCESAKAGGRAGVIRVDYVLAALAEKES